MRGWGGQGRGTAEESKLSDSDYFDDKDRGNDTNIVTSKIID